MKQNMLEVGLIGGLSFSSTVTYYELINRLANGRLGKAHSPRIIIDSLDFQHFADGMTAHDGELVTHYLLDSVKRLASAGAKCVAICCNTAHKYAGEVRRLSPIPLLNICELTAAAARKKGFAKIGLMGSVYSMEEDFYRQEFEKVGIDVVIPSPEERVFIQNVIETELSHGMVLPETRRKFIAIANSLIANGAQSVILACTEIPLVIKPEDIAVPLIDTVQVHSHAIVDFAMQPADALVEG